MTPSIPTPAPASNRRYQALYTLGGVAAVISILIILSGIATYPIWPYAPGRLSTDGVYALLQSSPVGGLFALDFFLLIGDLFSVFLFLALYTSLRRVNEAYALIALVLGILGLGLLIPARPILELFALSGRYAAAADPAEKSQLLAAGTALLALFDGTGWALSNLLGAISLVISSFLMLRSSDYGKPEAYVGLVTNLAVCGFFIPVVGKLLLFLSLPGYIIWYFQLGGRFFRWGRRMGDGKAQRP